VKKQDCAVHYLEEEGRSTCFPYPIIVLVVVSRGIGVWTPIKFLSFFKTFEKRTALIITWGGLRGGLSIALALNLPDNIGEGKNLILFLTYIVVLFTILVQGLTLKKIVK
jgi:CPA1 family monovalent cation:H+ antiporter